ncbi:MAG: hypothetical protein ABS68_00140 [Niastella sp. SCN 39-18]|nr:hypothetical protein [Sphingobacteriales bacterium]ODT55162.1 MAG: hypothetical protein ABS68_00140 [Niastella sp. SCN 39-18]OJW09126.1 MAG: hypothetical protein BGO53_00265 [Sphingobacteriales bacterium 39-19]
MNTNIKFTPYSSSFYQGYEIIYENGFYTITILPMLPFISLAAAKAYIDQLKTASNEPGTV